MDLHSGERVAYFSSLFLLKLWQIATLVAALCFPLAARAENRAYSAYELATLRAELERRGDARDLAPEGKLISSIEIVRLEVFDEHDPVPDFLNVFHTTTRELVIRRELLFAVGERFDRRRIDETARNLKSLIQLSLVLIVPLTDGEPGRVKLLVITKDVWSLRLNSNFQVGSEGFTYLLLNPSEWNVAGTHANVSGLFILRRSTYSAGVLASHGRILGTRLAGSVGANLVFNRSTGRQEGSFGNFSYGLPRYSEQQKWLYGVSLTWDEGITRVLKLPYRRERYVDVTSVTRSFGVQHKFELTLGAEADRRVYRSRVPSDVSPAVREEFERDDVPQSDTRISPFVSFAHFENRFLQTTELETLGLQEDVRLGPQLQVKLYPASSRVGSTRDLLGVATGLSYTFPVADGLVRAIGTSHIEHASQGRHQASLALALRVASPRLGFGRLIFDGLLENRYRNYLNAQSALGGDGRLRGYPAADTEVAGSAALRGNDLAVVNTEFRTSAVDILSAQCGLAAFYDAGGAADSFDAIDVKGALGVGLRILFPQANRIVFRADWAFPISAGSEPLPGAVFATFGQAFSMPEL